MPVWNDALTAAIEAFYKHLDANCARTSAQRALNSGLYLEYHEKDARREVLPASIAARKESVIFKYGMGKPEASIFIYRVGSTDPAIRMPEISRSVVHEEGLALLTQYIKITGRRSRAVIHKNMPLLGEMFE